MINKTITTHQEQNTENLLTLLGIGGMFIVLGLLFTSNIVTAIFSAFSLLGALFIIYGLVVVFESTLRWIRSKYIGSY